jgi:hypothetical protein
LTKKKVKRVILEDIPKVKVKHEELVLPEFINFGENPKLIISSNGENIS